MKFSFMMIINFYIVHIGIRERNIESSPQLPPSFSPTTDKPSSNNAVSIVTIALFIFLLGSIVFLLLY